MKPTFTSDSSEHEFYRLLEQARSGDARALGLLIDRYRRYLLKIAFEEGDTDLQAKAGDSDLVQNTCLQAIRGFPGFHGHTSDDLRAWLRQILLNQLGDFKDQFHTRKRDIGEEVSLQALAGESGHLDGALPDDASSPSAQIVRREEADWLDRALLELSELDRRIIEMRQKDGRPFAEIGQILGMSEDAAQKRWVRALHSLQEKVHRLYGNAFE